MTTLYRKYRPQTFAEVVGQNHIKLTLKNEIETNKIAHAYLFCGPRAVGKTTLARVFAKSINCQTRESSISEPCNKCQSCLDISSGRNMDIIEIDAASNTGVDNVRENIIASSRLAPSNSRYKVFIIDEVHMLSTASFNALLKTMEEPPAYMVFILCTTEIHKVPNTIISRCQRFDFKKIGTSDVIKKLKYIASMEKIEISDDVIESVARQSQGYMRDAESLFGQIISIAGHANDNGLLIINSDEAGLVVPRNDLSEALELIDFLCKKEVANAIVLINSLVNNGVDLKIFITDFIDLSRKMMLNKVGQNLGDKFGFDFGDATEKRAMEIGQNLSIDRFVEIIEAFLPVIAQIKSSFIVQLPIEIAVIKLCQTLPVQGVVNVLKTKTSSSFSEKAGQETSNKKQVLSQTVEVGSVDIQKKWSELMSKVREYNHSLSFILKVCQPRNLVGNNLCLAFKYKFHKDRVDDPQIKELIEKAINDVYGVSLVVSSVLDDSIEENVFSSESEVNNKIEQASESKDNHIDDLLNAFGGKVIN